jgi:hypothetical protein
MAAQKDLIRFVHDALAAGRSRADIEAALAQAGWSRKDIEASLAAYADTPFVPPVPRPAQIATPRHAFLYAVLFIAMAVTAINMVTLLHAQIDLAFADPAFEQLPERTAGRLRSAVAALLVAAPVYVLVSRHVTRSAAADDGILKSPVRKWLTYLALLVSALVFLGDAIYTVDRFLDGELTLRFALKAGAVALVSGAVFLHYLGDVERTIAGRDRHLAVVAAVVAVAVAATLVTVGGPQSARSDRFDRARYEDLAAIARALECERPDRTGARALPERLSAAALYEHCVGTDVQQATLLDDETGEPYVYVRLDDAHFRVCAEFRDASTVAAGIPAVHPGFDPATGCITGRLADRPAAESP